MSNAALRTAVTGEKADNPLKAFNSFMDKFKPQMALALPKHLNPDRMTRLALTAFSTNRALQDCTHQSIAASIMTASQLGLEIGVNGQAYLIPYKGTCTFVPGWKGLVDLVNRAGRSTVWTGAVHEGDEFDYALGDSPFVKHRPGDESDPAKITHVYAVGRVNGSQWPVIEVWPIKRVWKHRDKMNKMGSKHYSFANPEMYARKIPLLQVLKYMPSSIELTNAIAASNAAERGHGVTIDAVTSIIHVQDEQGRTVDPETGEIHNPVDADLSRPEITYAQVVDAIAKSGNPDALDAARDLIRSVFDPQQQAELNVLAGKRLQELNK